MAFTKKHYEAIAKAISESHEVAANSRLSLFTDKVCELFQEDNPRFDVARFRQAAARKEKAN